MSKATTPKLIEGKGQVIAAKNIRIELKTAFPGIKFSVTWESYSGGNSVRVSWIDGPTSDQVQDIIGKYKQGSFDGMQDLYEYNKDRSFTDNHGGAQYVFAYRSVSPAFVSKILGRLQRQGWEQLQGMTADDYFKGKIWNLNGAEHWFNKALSRHTFCVTRK